MLKEAFGTVVADGVQIKVWDSTADCRYLVLPIPPSGVDVQVLTVEELKKLITRDSLIGVSLLVNS